MEKNFNHIYEKRNEIRSKNKEDQVKVLVNIKLNRVKSRQIVLQSKDISDNGIFLSIDSNKHFNKVGDIVEIGFLINNKTNIRGGVIRQIFDDGIGIQLMDIEYIQI